MTRSNSEAAVRRGADLLERIKPGSVARLDGARVDISSGLDCPLGQTFGTFFDGITVLRVHGVYSMCTETEHGFWCDDFSPNRDSSLDALNEAWREEIARRRLAVCAPLDPAGPLQNPQFRLFSEQSQANPQDYVKGDRLAEIEQEALQAIA